MAKYPVKLLKDKDGTAFIPVVNSDSIITPEGNTLNDLLEEKQDLLTSGTNIKTINNESLLGSGNISIQGGGDATDVQVNGVSITQNNVANIVTQTAYNSLTNKIATKNDIPTQISQLTNNSGYITSSVDNLTNYTKTNDLSEVATSGSYEDLSNKPTIPSKMSDLTNDNNFVSDASYVHTDNNYTSTEKNKLSGIASGAEVNVQSNWTETNTSSDAYIKNKPTIPTVNNGTLTIQKNGTDVQTFTANQSSNVTANITVPTQVSELTNDSGYTTNTGTITKVQANGTDVASSGAANIPAATTSKYGVTELSSATNSSSETLAATPKAVKAAYDLAASKGTGTITGVSVNGTSVATSGVANITSVPASVLSGTIPSAVTATTQTSSDNSTKIATTAFVKTAIDNLPEPMVFKGSLGTGGTITSLPTNGSATVGDTYKVITDGTYASKAAKVGDTFICLTKTSSANTWELIPSGDDTGGTVTSVKINATSPIVVDNSTAITTSGERTISHAASGVTAGTYKSVTVDNKGHVTAGTNPTTLSGYGITDAKISNGTITLGSNTITPSTIQNIKDGSTTGSVRTSNSSSEDTNYTIGTYAFAEGYYTKASGGSSHAEGLQTTASGNQSHAEGNYTTASGDRSHAEGDNTVASNSSSHAEGYRTTASGIYGDHSEGYFTQASGGYGAHTEGASTRAIGYSSHAEGSGAVASNSYSHAEGWDTIASGKYSHAEGGRRDGYLFIGTVVSLNAENQTYEVSGVPKEAISDNLFYSGALFSETNGTDSDQRIVSAVRSSDTDNVTFTVSTFDSSIAVGDNFRIFAGSKASGNYSHAEGHRAYAIGNYSHAEGYNTIASGSSSHAEGNSVIASGSSSHAGGYYTKADKDYQTAIGKYNKNVNNALFEIGNGTADDARSNAFVVYSNGKAELGADPTSSMHATTKQYVDNKISSIALSNIKDGSASGSVRTVNSASEDSSYTIGQYAFTEGFGTKAPGKYSHSEGYYTIANEDYSHSEGYYTTASGDYGAHSEGYNTAAKGSYSHSEGKYTTAFNSGSHAEGYWARAVGKNSHSEGGWDSGVPHNIVGTVVSIDTENKTYEVSGLTRYIDSDNNYVGALYYHTSGGTHESYYISSETYDTTTNNFTFGVSYMDSSIVVGGSFYIKISSVALGDFSHSEGKNTLASGTASHAEGWNTIARYSGSHAEGSSTYAGVFAHAEGDHTEANGDYSHSEGYHTQANGDYSHSEGYYTQANGDYSHSEGIYTKGTGNYSHVEGWGSEASGSYSHAEGDHTIASGREGSHAEGYATVAAGASSHAEGGYSGYFQQGTVVSVDAENRTYEVSGLPVLYNASGYPIYNGASYSKATSGYFNDSYIIISSTRSNNNYIFTVSGFYTTIAVGDPFYITMGSKAQGSYSHAEGQTCLAIGDSSHAEGNRTIASGSCSHAEGNHTEASGSSSHASGYYTKANKPYQTAIGQYNQNVNNALLEIGNGTADDARSNAFVVYSDGRAELGADPTTAMGVATKQYVDNIIPYIDLDSIFNITSTNDDTYKEIKANILTGFYIVDNTDLTGAMFVYPAFALEQTGNTIKFAFRIRSYSTTLSDYDTHEIKLQNTSGTTVVVTESTVDKAMTDTGWVDLTPSTGTWNYFKCRRIGNVVYVRGYATSFAYSGSATVLTTLPEQFRPADIIYVYGFLAGRRMSRWYITNAGTLGIDWAANISDGSVYSNNATWHEFSTTYMVD